MYCSRCTVRPVGGSRSPSALRQCWAMRNDPKVRVHCLEAHTHPQKPGAARWMEIKWQTSSNDRAISLCYRTVKQAKQITLNSEFYASISWLFFLTRKNLGNRFVFKKFVCGVWERESARAVPMLDLVCFVVCWELCAEPVFMTAIETDKCLSF